ncbi:Fur family transcriptional regulator [Cohnella thailandensis]|uniref:Transcriptional repressor n=1 Tax=Cohnella thailandensis TaxID=557557 RepID=A0A841T6V3_9BACL|nr:transcriptional repressor [Cohnella thailandensis]MBB6636891.1 transcriptional repressor [Cohnella thailandensis]MBP1973229.1 Fur family peroxide stress response transcriptional regulator [Cohnella thailandensis]
MSRYGLTTPRKIVLEIVSEAHDHPTAADVIDRLKARGHSVAYATVYNSLRYLTEQGMIRELKLEGDASRYDSRTEDHQHIVCTECGRVDEVMTKTPQDWLDRIAAESGYEITDEQLLFKGVCPSCQASKTKR